MYFKLYILVKKELLQFFRNLPLLIIVLYTCTLDVYTASQFTMDLKNYPVAVYDMDKSQKSRELLGKIRLPFFRVTNDITDEKEIEDLILKGAVGLVVVVPKGFQNKIDKGKSSNIQLILDATASNTSELASSYLYSIAYDYSMQIVISKWQISSKTFELVPMISSQNRYEFNENLLDEWTMSLQEFLTMLTLIAVLLTASAMVNEKQFGTIEQLMVTPLRPYEIMISKILPMIGIFLVASFISIYCIMIPIVGVPLMGNPLDFFLLTIIFCFTSSGLGLLISTISNNLTETVLLTIMIIFPIMFLSGAWVPPEAMPMWMQYLIILSPLKYYLDIGIGIFLKGNSLLFMWKDFLSLTVLGIVIFGIGAIRFRKMFG